MIGRFLELSLHSEDVLTSIHFWERLGFVQLVTGDIWSHKYGVLTDGRLILGIHDFEFDGPALTWVGQDVAERVRDLESSGIELAFRKLGEEEFHELGFHDPDGQCVTVLEARTFTDAEQESDAISRLGRFDEYSIRVTDLESSVHFWEPLGFVAMAVSDDPHPHAELCNDAINLGLHQTRELPTPAVTFLGTDLAARIAWLESQDLTVDRGKDGGATLRSPEGLNIRMLNDED